MQAWPDKLYLPGASQPSDLPQSEIPCFPGAWGGGMFSYGGRGGRTFVITNLNDRGPGSFREACESGGPRIIVFNVSGVIQLKEVLRIRAPYITISGASAPGDGICISGETVEIDTHDVVIRHMRFRRGATWVGSRNDSLGGNPIGNIMIDHVSASWGLDENLSMYRHMYDHDSNSSTPSKKLPTVNITIQYSISSEALNTFNHSFGSTIGGLNSTFHHNLWACNAGRNPSVGMYGDFTFINNIIFNWRHRTIDGGDHRSSFNIINNYFKPGPITPASGSIRYRIIKPESERSKTGVENFGKAFVEGNIVEGHLIVSKDNWHGGVQPESISIRNSVLSQIRLEKPVSHAPLPIQSASSAYSIVLENSGAVLPKRDKVDQRIIQFVQAGNLLVKIKPGIRESLKNERFSEELVESIVDGISKGIITDPDQVGGLPTYTGIPYKDEDIDGLPDKWELENQLDPSNSQDGSLDSDLDGYSNIEEFLNGSDPQHYVDYTDLNQNKDPMMKSKLVFKD